MIQSNEIDRYIGAFPEHVQKKLLLLRETIKSVATDATEIISYQMPAYKQNGILVYFAVHKNHIGFYPTSSGITAFKKEISRYKWGPGSVQFPFDEELPVDLIKSIVAFRVEEDKIKSSRKKK